MTNHQWRIAARPHGLVKESDFRWDEAQVSKPSDGQVLVRNVYLSLDPTNRVWMNEADSYLPALKIGDVMRGGAIGVVDVYAINSSVAVVKLGGKLPLEPGYLLHGN